jgi:bla regulator protein blaR1
MNLIADHLWQSTLFAGVVWLLTLVLRRNRARVRHGLWLAASVKFLIPFSLFIALGSLVPRRAVPVTTESKIYVVMDQVSQPFTVASLPATLPPAPSPLIEILLSIWACGVIGIVCAWCVRLRRIQVAVRAGTPVNLDIRIKAMSSPTLLEPGVFGIFRPVLVLPEGITERLTPAQLQAVIAHELCHVRYRDNLIASIHMFVETLFWFHPLVWWIGKRMVEERERACDEEVVQELGEARAYAEGILNVCKVYVESPLTCVSGVTGANLKKRIEAIVTNRVALRLNFAKKAALAATMTAALAIPVGVGMMHAQSPAVPKFEVASI